VTVWERRDLPVLQALATSEDSYVREGYVMVGHGKGGEALGLELSEGEIHDAILTLQDAGYVDFNVQRESGPGAHFTNFTITGRGQQALGEWPLFDTIVAPETLALMLERLAEEAATDEEADNLRRSAGYVRTLSGAALRAFFTGAMSAALRGSLGLG
jgi:DNA-binding PadR family transcriptional regulator